MCMDTRLTVCPFCKKVHKTPFWLNVLCNCGAKYYINTNEWWDRKTGKIVKGTDWKDA